MAVDDAALAQRRAECEVKVSRILRACALVPDEANYLLLSRHLDRAAEELQRELDRRLLHRFEPAP